MRRDSTQADPRIDAGITPALTLDRVVGHATHANLQYCLSILGRHYETRMHKQTSIRSPCARDALNELIYFGRLENTK